MLFVIYFVSGGILLLICPHGVIYYFKFLRKHESERDHVDALLSLLNIPYVYIGDLAPNVGAHLARMNLSPEHRAYPATERSGAVYPLNEENADLEKTGKLPQVRGSILGLVVLFFLQLLETFKWGGGGKI